MVTNSIAYCAQVPQLYNYFQRSVEDISSQQNPPYSRQRNNHNQYKNRKQDNRRRDQQQPRDRRKF